MDTTPLDDAISRRDSKAMSKFHERRHRSRIACRGLARYARGTKIHGAHLLDVSAEGAQLLLEEAHSAPGKFRLELGGRVQLLAHTVWSEREGEGCQRVGVRFEAHSWGWEAALKDYLASLGGAA